MAERALTWYERLKRDHIDPVVEVISNNLPAIIAVGTSVAVVGIALQAVNDAEQTNSESKATLRAIEEKLQTAIETPAIVKVELGDDMELIGYGNRTE